MGAALRSLRILWSGILFASVLFFVLTFVLAPDQPPPGLAFAAVLGAVAVTMALASSVVPRALYRSALRRARISTVVFGAARRGPGPAPDRVVVDAAVQRVLAQYGVPFVLGLALSEAVGLFGFVLGFLGFPVTVVLPFFVVCWALIVSRYPTEASIIGPAERVAGVRLRPGPSHPRPR